MSQFSQKYYKHFFLAEKKAQRRIENDYVPEREYTFYTYFSRYRILEIITILLLLLILYCLCTQRNTVVATAPVILEQQKVTVPEKPIFSTASVQNKPVQNINEMNKTIDLTQKSLGYVYHQKVLPDGKDLHPKSEVVSIGEYLYFANDIHGEYPDFIDSSDLSLIPDKAPKCYKAECNVSGVTSAQMQMYATWLSNMTGENYLFQNGKIVLKQ